jgi:hypothetical protein
MNSLQIDNSFLEAKISLRMNHLPDKESFKVLDAFSGQGIIWDEIAARTGRKIEVLKIDIKKGLKDIYLVGDNRKFIASLQLKEFDVINLDAYGVPFDLLDYLLTYDRARELHHRMFLTFIQSQFGRLPMKMLNRLGYTDRMIRRIPTLFNRNGIGRLKDYLGTMGIESMWLKSSVDKHYIFIQS